MSNDFKIDYVFPYVDSNDQQWRELYNRYAPKQLNTNWDKWSAGEERFRSNDLLKYVFRGIEQNIQFINNIIILVMSESQLPSWLDKSKVKIITHEQFIPKVYLPTFNSSTIEMFLHNIPDLSEQFIYSNDDVYPIRKLLKEDFFFKGYPKFGLRLRSLHSDWKGDILRYKDRELILARKDGKVEDIQHVMTPYLKSTLRTVFNKHSFEILNSCTKFRCHNNYNQWIYAIYQAYFVGYKNQPLSHLCFQLSKNCTGIDKDFTNYKAVCINDDIDTTEEQIEIVTSKLNNIFPNKSKFEL